MIRFIHRIMLGFVAIFALSIVGVVLYALYWQFPEQRCALHGNWWDSHDRVCAKPVFLPSLTHRPIGAPKLKPTVT